MHLRRFFLLFVVLATLASACASSDDVPPALADADAEEGGATTDAATGDDFESSDEATTDNTTTTIAPRDTVAPPAGILSAADANAALGRGINIGNTLDAPREGDWANSVLEAEFFEIIADAGFEHIRLPISWAGYADTAAPYTIPETADPTITHPDYDNIFDRVEWAIDQALANDLRIIVNMHHYDAAHENPTAHHDRMVAMWTQIAAKFADQPDEVYFELFNEPHGVYDTDPELWNSLAADLISAVRETNPTRKVIVGPVGFNHISRLEQLVLPDDPYLIGTVHLYEPFVFTHQGATWVDPQPPTGIGWDPQGVALPSGVTHSSWDTDSSIDANGDLILTYARQWAGYSIEWNRPKDFERVQIEMAGGTSVRFGCRIPDADVVDLQSIELTSDATMYTIDLSVCPETTTGFTMMNETGNLDPVVVTELQVCIVDLECERTYQSAAEYMRGRLQIAADWGAARGIPMHLGEFGAFSANGAAPLADRAAWTATVAEAAADLGLSTSYWEFHLGYGAYDPDAGAWIPELLDALMS